MKDKMHMSRDGDTRIWCGPIRDRSRRLRTTDWKLVTCKRCLYYRRKGKAYV